MRRDLRAVLPGNRSQDIITTTGLTLATPPGEHGPEVLAGPVKTSLDLSQFIMFNGQKTRGRRGKWMSVNTRGDITISDEIGREIKGEMAKFYLNRKGTILVMKESLDGIRLRHDKRSNARHASCTPLKNKLIELGVKPVARFVAEWDEELKAWVGRREY